ncbi:glycosyltransferase [Pseudanabaena sp. FACHB-2040]|uniref:glycosyltransferase n=1 Tax=Pseudanabaena sp. FACHB-2040 TaxID=2692859 RepID=UPI001681F9B2|nr:glycosyltransferase [Pseudanabaena sp. FACHB-2040]MBD2260576.1 glycosyltransferase [Pseudanabaena sp. FACHB-2040]
MSKPHLHLSFFLPPLIGAGGERVVLSLAKVFVDWGFKVDLVVPETSGRHAKFMKTVPEKVRVIDLATPKTKTVYLKKLFKLKQYLEAEKPDVMLANVDYVGVANFARQISKSQTKIIQVVHSNLSREFGTIPGIGQKVKPLFVKWFYPSSDATVAVSRGVAEDLAEMSGIALDDIQVIYNPVVTAELPVQALEPIDHPWFQSNEVPIVLGAGRLMYQKDFATLIRAFAKVRQDRPCRLVIIGGEDELRPELEGLIRELGLEADAQLPGFAANPYAYMAKASVFVLSSRYEGFGNVLVEAMATGTPVVSTDCKDGPAEILKDGEFGRLVPVADPDALATAILHTLNHPLSADILKNRAQEFSAERIAGIYLSAIEKTLA